MEVTKVALGCAAVKSSCAAWSFVDAPKETARCNSSRFHEGSPRSGLIGVERTPEVNNTHNDVANVNFDCLDRSSVVMPRSRLLFTPVSDAWKTSHKIVG